MAPVDLDPLDVAIVGGGFSGIAVAAQLARLAPEMRVALFERRERVGPGLAYSTTDPGHLTNSRAAGMSAFEDEPDHFVRWLDGRFGARDFVPRGLFGEYLESVAASLARPGYDVINASVVAVRAEDDGTFRVVASDGSERIARGVALATGNLRFETSALPAALLAHPRFARDPWSADYHGIDGDVLIVGSGLSALDAMTALTTAGFTGTIHVVSRRGLFPRAHADVAPMTMSLGIAGARSAVTLMRQIRTAIARAAKAGTDWRAAMDALRREVPRLWHGLTMRERARFLRHARRYWEVHRHRAPEQIDAMRQRLLESGRLVVHRGRIDAAKDAAGKIAVDVRGRDGATHLVVDYAIDALGPVADYARCDDPLIVQLLADGLAAPDSLGLGLAERRQGIYLCGPAELWRRYEATAVPELRAKAARLAAHLVGRLRYTDGL